MTSARDTILSRIRTALPQEPCDVAQSYASVARSYIRRGALDPRATLELFIDRLLDYDTEILQVETGAEVASVVEDALRRAAESSLLVPAAFPAQWLPRGIDTVVDHSLSTAEMERAQAVLTTCEIAIASTGTIILVHHGAQGRRVLTLLPDHHICVVRRDQVVETVPEAWAALGPNSALPITTISGPSATSDIEMTRIRGVHGPRRLTVVLYGPVPESPTL